MIPMKSNLSPLLFTALGALVLLAGCETSTSERHPRTTRTMVLSVDRPSPDVEMELVSAVRVVLPGPEAGTGLVWEIASNNNKVLDQMGPMKAVPASGETGSKPGTEVTFYALKPGKSILRFFLLDPSLKEAVPTAKCQLTVRVID